MARYRVQVILGGPTGLPKDNFENVWHFSSTGAASDADCTAIATQISGIYVGTFGGGDTVASYLSSAVGAGVILKFYDEDSAEHPRPIFATKSFGFDAHPVGTTAIPEQIALCLSYYSTANQPRHRGRIYIGPFALRAVTQAVSPDENGRGARPAPGLRSTLAGVAGALVASSESGSTKWCLRSGGGTDASKTGIVVYEPVQHGWVDDEWDSAYRRRLEASTRTTF